MDVETFSDWVNLVALLTPDQRRQAFMVLALSEADDASTVANEQAREVAVDRSPLGSAKAVPSTLTAAAREQVEALGCPNCDAKEVRPWGRASGLARYRCTDRRRTFNALTGTPLARLRHKDRWPDQARASMAGESVAKAAARCEVAYTTAFRWRHRFLMAPARDKPTRLVGLVEADETFILESFKGRRAGLPRASRKRGGKPKQTGLSAE
jgi:transposase-like protein